MTKADMLERLWRMGIQKTSATVEDQCTAISCIIVHLASLAPTAEEGQALLLSIHQLAKDCTAENFDLGDDAAESISEQLGLGKPN